jgi:hypothetical protein
VSAKTWVVLDPESERGRYWQELLGRTRFECQGMAGPGVRADDGPRRGEPARFYKLPLAQFDPVELEKICTSLAERFGATVGDVSLHVQIDGFVPLIDGDDCVFGADMRMVM